MLILLLLTVLVYVPALAGPFVFDDVFIERIPMDGMDQWSFWGALSFSPRSLLAASYVGNYLVLGHDPFSYHVVNLAIHLINAILVYALIGVWIRGLPQWIGVAFFALHPIQTESVSYISGRSESLAATLVLAGLLGFLYLRRRRPVLGWLLVGIVSALGISVKETVILLPVLAATVELTERRWPLAVLFAVPAIAGIVIWRAWFTVERTLTGIAGMIRVDQYVWTQYRAFWRYVRLLIWPDLNLDWDMPAYTHIDPSAIASALGIVLLLLLLIKTTNSVVSCGVLIFMCIFVRSGLVRSDLLVEHRVYLPLIGIAILLGYAVQSWKRLRIPAIALILVLSVLTYQRNQVWADDLKLWTDTVRKSPMKPRARFNLAATYRDHQDFIAAFNEFNRAATVARVYPDDSGRIWSLSNMALILVKFRAFGEAESILRAGLAEFPNSSILSSNLGNVYVHKGELHEAMNVLTAAIDKDPGYGVLWFNRAAVFQRNEQCVAAIANYHWAHHLEPELKVPDNPCGNRISLVFKF